MAGEPKNPAVGSWTLPPSNVKTDYLEIRRDSFSPVMAFSTGSGSLLISREDASNHQPNQRATQCLPVGSIHDPWKSPFSDLSLLRR